MKNYIVFLFIFLFLFPIANAATLSMSPQQINFVGNTNERICNKVSLKTEDKATLLGETKWAKKDYSERRLKSHNLSAEELGILVDYPSKTEVDQNKKIDVCITGKKPGNYHGIILYRMEGKPVRVGIWINVSLEGNSLSSITGNFIGGEVQNSKTPLYTIPIVLLGILGALLYRLNTTKEKVPKR